MIILKHASGHGRQSTMCQIPPWETQMNILSSLEILTHDLATLFFNLSLVLRSEELSIGLYYSQAIYGTTWCVSEYKTVPENGSPAN